VTITNSLVSGYDIGSLLEGTYKRTVTAAPDRDGPTGRIKIGTESEGDFRNITISNIVFDRSRGLALESVDGAHIEDIVVSNISMRQISNAPFFIRLGARMRAPEGVAIGSIRRIPSAMWTFTTLTPLRVDYQRNPRPRYRRRETERYPDRLSRWTESRSGGETARDLVNTFFFRATGAFRPANPTQRRSVKKISGTVHVRHAAGVWLLHPPCKRH